MTMTVGSLFSGIGGLDLGLERAGMTVRWQSEIEPYACKVLAKHWPEVPNHGDITKIDWAEVESVDLVCGGFPCQDISVAGKGAGIAQGTRSGLWFEFERCVRVLRPRYVLVENVRALAVRGLDIVLGSLARLGYDAEWACVSAASVGAPHRRERLFIVAHSEHGQHDQQQSEVRAADQRPKQGRSGTRVTGACDSVLADSESNRVQGLRASGQQEPNSQTGARLLGRDGGADVGYPDSERSDWGGRCTGETGRCESEDTSRIFRAPERNSFWSDWQPLSRVRGGADGVPAGMDRLVPAGIPLLTERKDNRAARLKALGNAVVPQVAEHIGRCILRGAA